MEEGKEEKIKVYFDLVENPRASRGSGWVAIVVNDNIQFLKANIPEFSKGTLVAGTYLLEKGSYVIVKRDYSSHKNSRQYYTLYQVIGGEEKVKEVASIDVINGNLSFKPAGLEDIYITAPSDAKSKIIYALIQYLKQYITATQLLTP